MPEYNKIQTCYEIKNQCIFDLIENYINFLQILGISNEKIFRDLRKLKLNFQDDFPYVYFTAEKEITKYSEILVIPHLSFFKNENNFFAVCELLIESENIFSYPGLKYTKETVDLIRNISLDMFQSFQNSPIYFTDEMQDSMEIENEWNKYDVKWEFDLAIIPIKEAHRYKQIKNDFTKITNTWYIEFYNNKKFE